jgi:hypothetical protein
MAMMPVATNKDCWRIEWIQERSSLSWQLQDNETFSRLPPVMVNYSLNTILWDIPVSPHGSGLILRHSSRHRQHVAFAFAKRLELWAVPLKDSFN